ncbi:MAG: SDR family oxidoreductase [SAR202 cluster bacterium]|jgi:3-oxoacyl-[acyl-carrier protein] reductase|nr:SDR family oxidoreductase [SAR202 cluster bacterium]MDP6300144.1 SDR family oxidoreductase [SAR202 cluster bacterium]MDP7102912.1 SDR family oxidoreductase [SAR202 cluster bacterium]MDP7225779.1 SDR family oxidoreductase [SAR202 cluster bacterium]HJO81856.1 SDR family oxidoreductase [SAR202 cluster bacterium]|tara:strand:+ start:5650 stop:6396 length:747 start_codon:yes stop_codon:yes gene_type:complete
MDLDGKVAVVTGGNGGLGQRICHALANAGCHIAVVYAQSRDEAEQVADDLGGDSKAAAFQCDVTDPAQVESLASGVVAKFGRLDILVNDAAYNKWIAFDDLDGMTDDEWSRMLAVNLTGPMMAIKAVVPEMRRNGGGRIVNISSVAGLGPQGSSIGYAVSKAGLIHLTKCMAVALAPDILVNCVAPGFLEGTRATANLDPEFQARARTGSLLRRPVDKDDVGRQVAEFCATDSTTGQTLVMDSGRIFH